MVEERPMTARAVLERDQEVILDALRSIELPPIDLTRLSRLRDDLAALDRPHVDLSRLDLPSVDLSHLDLGRFGRRPSRQNLGFLAVRPTPLFFLGLLAALGGLLFGAALAYFMHPAQGPKRRRWLKRRLGLASARPGGKGGRHLHGHGASDQLIAVPIETGTPAQDQPAAAAEALEQAAEASVDSVADVAAEQPTAD
jgi:hypothetical protein